MIVFFSDSIWVEANVSLADLFTDDEWNNLHVFLKFYNFQETSSGRCPCAFYEYSAFRLKLGNCKSSQRYFLCKVTESTADSFTSGMVFITNIVVHICLVIVTELVFFLVS